MVTEKGFGINRKALMLLVDHIGNDLSRLVNEVEKILVNLGTRKSINEEDIEKFKSSTNTAFRGIYHAGVWRHVRKNGVIMYVDIVTHDILYKGHETRLVLANDVTEKYIAEEKLKESYESIRTLTGHLQNVREEERLHIAREIHDELGQLLTVLKMDVSWLNKKIEPGNNFAKEKLTEILSLGHGGGGVGHSAGRWLGRRGARR